jgi:hypothetical protein
LALELLSNSQKYSPTHLLLSYLAMVSHWQLYWNILSDNGDNSFFQYISYTNAQADSPCRWFSYDGYFNNNQKHIEHFFRCFSAIRYSSGENSLFSSEPLFLMGLFDFLKSTFLSSLYMLDGSYFYKKRGWVSHKKQASKQHPFMAFESASASRIPASLGFCPEFFVW